MLRTREAERFTREDENSKLAKSISGARSLAPDTLLLIRLGIKASN
jgi:hypothetical protein